MNPKLQSEMKDAQVWKGLFSFFVFVFGLFFFWITPHINAMRYLSQFHEKVTCQCHGSIQGKWSGAWIPCAGNTKRAASLCWIWPSQEQKMKRKSETHISRAQGTWAECFNFFLTYCFFHLRDSKRQRKTSICQFISWQVWWKACENKRPESIQGPDMSGSSPTTYPVILVSQDLHRGRWNRELKWAKSRYSDGGKPVS